MSKKLLTLGIIITLLLTGCNGSSTEETKSITPNEQTVETEAISTMNKEEWINEYVKALNNSSDLVDASFDDTTNTLNVVLASDTIVGNINSLRDSMVKTNKEFIETLGSGYTLQHYFEDNPEQMLLLIKDGEIIEDNYEEVVKNRPRTYKTDTATYQILGYDILNDKYDSSKKILAIRMNFTNHKDEPKNPWFAVAVDFSARQVTDTITEELNGGLGRVPDDYYPDAVKLGDSNINPGVTVEVVISYAIEYSELPVYFMDRFTNGEKFMMEMLTN